MTEYDEHIGRLAQFRRDRTDYQEKYVTENILNPVLATGCVVAAAQLSLVVGAVIGVAGAYRFFRKNSELNDDSTKLNDLGSILMKEEQDNGWANTLHPDSSRHQKLREEISYKNTTHIGTCHEGDIPVEPLPLYIGGKDEEPSRATINYILLHNIQTPIAGIYLH